MRTPCILLLCLGLLLSFPGPTNAAPPDKRFDPITDTCRILSFQNLRQGARMFRQVCQSCHHAGYDNGLRDMEILIPRSYSPGRWTRIFTERYPNCARNGSWEKLSTADIQKLNDYLYRGGYGTWEDYTQLEFC